MAEQLQPSPESIASFIDQMLNAKDPAAVGLKKILRKQTDAKNDFPLRSIELEEFDTAGRGTKKLSSDDRYILELEKKVADLQVELQQQKEKTVSAIQSAYTKGKTEGRETGRADGLKTASETFQKKVDQMQQRFESMLLVLETSKRSIFHHTEHLLIKLCLIMVKKILRREVTADREIVLSVVKQALSYIGHHEKMVIRVAPDDLEIVSGRKDFWLPIAERLKEIAIEPDERIERGGCIIESNSGIVDARLGVQISELEALVENTWATVASSIGAGTATALPDSGIASVNKQSPPPVIR